MKSAGIVMMLIAMAAVLANVFEVPGFDAPSRPVKLLIVALNIAGALLVVFRGKRAK